MAKNGREAESTESVVPAWDAIAALKRTNIEGLAARYLEVATEIATLEAERETLKKATTKLLIKADVKSVQAAGQLVTRVDGKSVSISRGNLLKTLMSRLKLSAKRAEEVADEATTVSPYVTTRFTVIAAGEE